MIHGEPSLEGFSMNRHGLRSDQFARIKKLLPGRPGSVGRDSQLGNRLGGVATSVEIGLGRFPAV
jgi:hypothetical protein